SLHMTEVDVVSLLKQVHLELSDKIAESDIEFRFQLPEEKVILTLDGQKTYRIFENLMVNILKSAMPGTRAYLEIRPEETGVTVSMRNVSARELSVSPEELTERFVRGDESRNTDGSGLGLAIARAFVEAQGGTMSVRVEDDVFKVTLFWKYPEA
ncbi:MAG: ATP-binding protein, partial [Hungatella hathewayi]